MGGIRDGVLADYQGQGVNGGGDEDPFGHAQFLTLHDQACVQTQTDKGVGDDEEDPFRDLCRRKRQRWTDIVQRELTTDHAVLPVDVVRHCKGGMLQENSGRTERMSARPSSGTKRPLHKFPREAPNG